MPRLQGATEMQHNGPCLNIEPLFCFFDRKPWSCRHCVRTNLRIDRGDLPCKTKRQYQLTLQVHILLAFQTGFALHCAAFTHCSHITRISDRDVDQILTGVNDTVFFTIEWPVFLRRHLIKGILSAHTKREWRFLHFSRSVWSMYPVWLGRLSARGPVTLTTILFPQPAV